MIYNTPEEAIAACDINCENVWKRFITINNMKESDSPEAFAIAKNVFRAGYMCGALFVSDYVTKNQNHPPINPSSN